MMYLYNDVKQKLQEFNIQVQVVEHEPALTVEQADSFIEGIEGVRTKTLFLTNKKKTKFYLLIIDDSKRLDMNKFKCIVSESHVKMASENTLFDKMGLTPGIVSPFGLLNNKDMDIDVYFDKEIMNERRLSFHPNTNEKTIFINTDDILEFIRKIGFEAKIIEI